MMMMTKMMAKTTHGPASQFLNQKLLSGWGLVECCQEEDNGDYITRPQLLVTSNIKFSLSEDDTLRSDVFVVVTTVSPQGICFTSSKNTISSLCRS